MPNVVTYCRVSSEEQAEKDNSIPAQRKALRSWVAQNVGHVITEDFVDDGVSAYAPADRRPGFCAMVSFCRKNQVDAILVHKLDRFSRNREESILFKSLLRKHGVQVKSVTEQFDPESPQGFLYEGMIEVINQFYSMNLGTETLKGMRENASRGWVNGGAVPYGYERRKVVDGNGPEHITWALGDDAEVAVVREIFRLADEEGLGNRCIAAALNRRGVPAPGRERWGPSTVWFVLKNQVYAGDIVWFKSRRKGRTGRTKTAPEEQVVQRDAHPAIVSRELFERCRAKAKSRKFAAHTTPHQHVDYLLGRLIRCDHCGGSFVGRRREYTNHRGEKQTSLTYYCSGYLFRGKETCASLPIDMAWLDGVVVDAIRARLTDADGWNDLESRVRERIGARRRSYGQDPAGVRAKLADIDRRVANYWKALGDGMDAAQCKRLIDDLQARRIVVEHEAETLAREDYYTLALEKNLAALGRFRTHFADGFDRLPFGVRRQVVLAFVEGIRVHDRREVVIHLKVALDNLGIQHLTDEAETALGAGSEGRADNAMPDVESRVAFCQSREVWLPLLDSN